MQARQQTTSWFQHVANAAEEHLEFIAFGLLMLLSVGKPQSSMSLTNRCLATTTITLFLLCRPSALVPKYLLLETGDHSKGEDFAQIPDPSREDGKKGEMISTGPDERAFGSCQARFL